MALLALDRLWPQSQERRSAVRAAPPSVDHIATLLAENVAQRLQPHFDAALDAYSPRDHARLCAAYGLGALILADLLSQDANLPGWRRAATEALRRLMQRSNLEAITDLGCLEQADDDVAWLKQKLDVHPAYREICDLFALALETPSRKTAGRGPIALRAAMARLEALARSTGR